MFARTKKTQDILKKNAARAAIKYIKDGMIIGIGTGTTIDYFITELRDSWGPAPDEQIMSLLLRDIIEEIQTGTPIRSSGATALTSVQACHQIIAQLKKMGEQ